MLRPDDGPGDEGPTAEARALSRAEMGLDPRVGVAPGVRAERMDRGGVAVMMAPRRCPALTVGPCIIDDEEPIVDC